MVKWLILLSLLFMVGAVNAQDYEAEFVEDICPFGEVDGIECGYLLVPENRDNPDGTWVELAVAIINVAPNPDPIPVLYLEGGPGGAPLLAADSWFSHPLVQSHTIILYDQRGTGFSYPSLNCYEIEEGEAEDPVAECRDRLLDEGVDLQAYNSKNSAHDIADLMATLGYEQVRLYGISYGTKLALTTIREHPELVHSAVIDSVYPPENDDTAEGLLYMIEAIEGLFARCAADSACNAAYPNLADDFYALVERLNESPEEMNVETEDGSFEAQEVYGDDVLGGLFQALYDTTIIPYLPYGLNLLANPQGEDDFLVGMDILDGFPPVGDADDYGEEEFLADRPEVMDYMEEYGDIDDSEGMNYSVDCQEEYLQGDYERALEIAESAPFVYQEYGLVNAEQTQADCEIWGVAPSDPIETELVVSDIPVLLVSGGLDPITPPSSGDSALRGLSNGIHVVFANAGHGVTGSAGNPQGDCAIQIMLDFWADPNAALDTSCVEPASAISFYVE